MSTLDKSVPSLGLPFPQTQDSEHAESCFAHRRLTQVFLAAREIPFDDTSRFIFFSDCHRGDNSLSDAFMHNEMLFIEALRYYYKTGFTYVEVGDGDELWKNRSFVSVVQAHPRTFELLHQFAYHQRLHLIAGNHDIAGPRDMPVDKGGLLAEEGLTLCHSKTGQRLFVTHGHQADFTSDALLNFSRFIVRNIWRRIQLFGFFKFRHGSGSQQPIKQKIERRIINWVQVHRQAIICGHTHRPLMLQDNARPYFNTGSCVVPGMITGLELDRGKLSLIRWRAARLRGPRSPVVARRERLAPSKPLHTLFKT